MGNALYFPKVATRPPLISETGLDLRAVYRTHDPAMPYAASCFTTPRPFRLPPKDEPQMHTANWRHGRGDLLQYPQVLAGNKIHLAWVVIPEQHTDPRGCLTGYVFQRADWKPIGDGVGVIVDDICAGISAAWTSIRQCFLDALATMQNRNNMPISVQQFLERWAHRESTIPLGFTEAARLVTQLQRHLVEARAFIDYRHAVAAQKATPGATIEFRVGGFTDSEDVVKFGFRAAIQICLLMTSESARARNLNLQNLPDLIDPPACLGQTPLIKIVTHRAVAPDISRVPLGRPSARERSRSPVQHATSGDRPVKPRVQSPVSRCGPKFHKAGALVTIDCRPSVSQPVPRWWKKSAVDTHDYGHLANVGGSGFHVMGVTLTRLGWGQGKHEVTQGTPHNPTRSDITGIGDA